MSIDSSLIDNNVKHKPTHYDGLATADVRLSRLSKLSKEHKSERFVHPFPYALLFFARVRTALWHSSYVICRHAVSVCYVGIQSKRLKYGHSCYGMRIGNHTKLSNGTIFNDLERS